MGPGSRPVTSSVADNATVIRDPVTLGGQRRFPIASRLAALNPALGVIAFAARDGTVHLLDIDTGRLRVAQGRHDGPVTAMAFSADGHRLVTAGRDERLIVWDTDRATAVETLQARGAGPIQDVAVSADGRTAYTAGRDGTVVTWDLAGTRRLERPLIADGKPAAARLLAPSGDGSRFAIAGPTGSIAVFDGHTERLTARVRTGRRPPSGVALSPDGRTLAATRADGRLGFWDAATGRQLGALQYAYAHPARVTLAFSGDGRWLVTGEKNPEKSTIVRLWDVRRHTPVESADLDRLSDLSLNQDGTLLAATPVERGFYSGLVIASVPALKVIRTVPAPVGTVGRFTPDGRSLIYADRDGRVDLRHTHLETGRPATVGFRGGADGRSEPRRAPARHDVRRRRGSALGHRVGPRDRRRPARRPRHPGRRRIRRPRPQAGGHPRSRQLRVGRSRRNLGTPRMRRRRPSAHPRRVEGCAAGSQLRARVHAPVAALELIGELPEDRAAEWQVAQVILERGKAGDGLAAGAEGGNPVRDDLLSVRDDLEDRAAKCLRRAPLRLIDTPQVLVNLRGGHSLAVYERWPGEINAIVLPESCFGGSTSIWIDPVGSVLCL